MNATSMTGSWAGWIAVRPTNPSARPTAQLDASPSVSETSAYTLIIGAGSPAAAAA